MLRPPRPSVFRLAALSFIVPALFPMSVIVSSLSLKILRPIPLSIAPSLGGHFVWMVESIAFSIGGHSVGMSGPVPGTGSPLHSPSSGFFGQALCDFIVVQVNVVVVGVIVVAWWAGRDGASVSASAGLFVGRHRGMAVELVGVSEGA